MNSNSSATTASLKTKVWDDADIRKIDSEQMARFAYESSDSLKEQYVSILLFVSHWQGERKLYRLGAAPFADAGPSDEVLKHEWDASPAVREEFRGSFPSYTAFLRADRGGQIRILRR